MSTRSSGTTDNTLQTPSKDKIDLDGVFAAPTRDEWLTQALAGLPTHDALDTLERKTLDGLSIDVLYDTSPTNTYTHLGQNTASGGSWDSRLRVSVTTEVDSNKKIIEGLSNGNASVEIHVSEKTDLDKLLSGVMLDISPISLRSGEHFKAVANQFKKYSNSIDITPIECSFNADPIGDWLNGYSDIQPDESSLQVMAGFAVEYSAFSPNVQCVLVDLAVHHNAGASAIQELTAGMMSATLYLEAMLEQGMSLEAASQTISFQIACDADVLMGVVKLRSFANLWRHLLLEIAKTHNLTITDEFLQPRIVVESSQRYLSRVDHWNNHLRNIAACSAAAISSAQTILIHPHDQIAGWQAESDTELGERMARNLPIILDRECGLTHVTDPMAGSYAVDTLTQQLSDATWDALTELGNASAWLTAVLNGNWQKQLSDLHEQRLSRLKDELDIMVGVNRYQPTNNTEAENSLKKSSGSIARLKPVRDAEAFEGVA